MWPNFPGGAPLAETAPTGWSSAGFKRADGQADIFSGGAYTWRAILTDEQEAAPEEVVAFYNGRGASERLFDVMGNDFGWSKLPCSLLSHNTAFMILTGIIANFYRYLIERYAQQLSWLQPTFRLKEVYLPLHQRPRQVDQDRPAGCAQTLHRQGLQPPARPSPLGATNVWKRNIVYGRGVHTSR
ncbi:MAG: transposase [Balneolaceae bacterium]|nr:transposase [Balneolaceae bacterium]